MKNQNIFSAAEPKGSSLTSQPPHSTQDIDCSMMSGYYSPYNQTKLFTRHNVNLSDFLYAKKKHSLAWYKNPG